MPGKAYEARIASASDPSCQPDLVTGADLGRNRGEAQRQILDGG